MFFGESWLDLLVRPNDLDTLGHVNNAVVLEYLEAGRWHWLERMGLGRGGRVVAVIARIEIDYMAEIPADRIEVSTRLESPTEAEFDEGDLTFRAQFRQRVHLAKVESPAVDALVTVAFLDAAGRCLVPLQNFLTAAVPD